MVRGPAARRGEDDIPKRLAKIMFLEVLIFLWWQQIGHTLAIGKVVDLVVTPVFVRVDACKTRRD